MAANANGIGPGIDVTHAEWVELEDTDEILVRERQMNPILDVGTAYPMSSRQRVIDISAERSPKALSGGASNNSKYPWESGEGLQAIITAEKFGDRVALDEDKLADMTPDGLRSEVAEIANGEVLLMNRAMFGGLGDTYDDLSVDVPFTSIAHSLFNGRALQGGDVDPARLSNIIHLDYKTPLTYQNFVDCQGNVDESEYYNPADMIWMLDISFKRQVQGLVDENGLPLMGTIQNGMFTTFLDVPARLAMNQSLAPRYAIPIPCLEGAGVPASTFGTDGQFYNNTAITTATNKIYRKTGGAWAALTSGGSSGRLAIGSDTDGINPDASNDNAGSFNFNSTLRGGESYGAGVLSRTQGYAGIHEERRGKQVMAVYCNKKYLKYGRRLNPMFQIGAAQARDDYDSVVVKFRERVGFAPGILDAFSVIIKDTADAQSVAAI